MKPISASFIIAALLSSASAYAARSDRPDYGPMGAYDGWIPLTAGEAGLRIVIE